MEKSWLFGIVPSVDSMFLLLEDFVRKVWMKKSIKINCLLFTYINLYNLTLWTEIKFW